MNSKSSVGAAKVSLTDPDQKLSSLQTHLTPHGEEESLSTVDRNAKQRESTVEFPDMSLATLPLEMVIIQCHPRQRKSWNSDEVKVDKIISWIEALPNWKENDKLKLEHQMCLYDKKE